MSLHVNLSSSSNSLNYSNSASFMDHLVEQGTELEERGQFVISLVHEIRTPLTTINLAAEMLKSLVMDEYQKEYLEIILRGSGKISGIVSDLLHSSLQAGELTNYTVEELMDEILEEVSDRILLRDVVICKQYNSPYATIKGNRSQMKIAVSNIIINAIESVNPGSGQLQLVTRNTGGLFVVEIGDNGCGISKANLKNIFRPYFTTKQNGLGIGLSATCQILRDEKVEIKVESVKGMGTRFFLLFTKTT